MQDPPLGHAGSGSLAKAHHRNIVRRGLHKVHKYISGAPVAEQQVQPQGSVTNVAPLAPSTPVPKQEPLAAALTAHTAATNGLGEKAEDVSFVPASSETAISDTPFQMHDTPLGGLSAAPASDTPSVAHSNSSLTDDQGETRIGHWASFRHVNGVAIYQETENSDGEGGALMVSAVVRASPTTVFKTLMAVDGRGRERVPLKFHTKLLQKLDDNNRILKGYIMPSPGLGALLCAPREVVMQQSWREDESGTYIVLFRSVDHPDAPAQPRPWYHWHAPIRSQGMTAGWTIAPLKPNYTAGNTSQECLVTYVLKLNLDGWILPVQRLRMLPQYLQDQYNSFSMFTFLDPILLSIMTLREKVEQDRFVVAPWEMGQQADPQEAPPAPPVDRRASMLSRMSSKPHPTSDDPRRTLTVASSVLATPRAGEAIAPVAPLSSSVPTGPPYGQLPQKFWSSPGAAGFKVRGPTYLQDRRKIRAHDPVFELVSADLVVLQAPTTGIAAFLDSVRLSTAPFTFVIQIQIPGPPYLSLICSWAASTDPASLRDLVNNPEDRAEVHPFDISLTRFLEGDSAEDDRRRSAAFKLIPSVAEGSWVIKQSVGNTPVLLGQKLVTTYTRGQRWFEVDVDVASSTAASLIVNHVKGATKHLVIDMAILLEGHTEQELPETLLGSVRLSHLDMSKAVPLDTAVTATAV